MARAAEPMPLRCAPKTARFAVPNGSAGGAYRTGIRRRPPGPCRRSRRSHPAARTHRPWRASPSAKSWPRSLPPHAWLVRNLRDGLGLLAVSAVGGLLASDLGVKLGNSLVEFGLGGGIVGKRLQVGRCHSIRRSCGVIEFGLGDRGALGGIVSCGDLGVERLVCIVSAAVGDGFGKIDPAQAVTAAAEASRAAAASVTASSASTKSYSASLTAISAASSAASAASLSSVAWKVLQRHS